MPRRRKAGGVHTAARQRADGSGEIHQAAGRKRSAVTVHSGPGRPYRAARCSAIAASRASNRRDPVHGGSSETRDSAAALDSSAPRTNSKNSRSRVRSSPARLIAAAISLSPRARGTGDRSVRAPCRRCTARTASAGYPETRWIPRPDRMPRARAGVTDQWSAASSTDQSSMPLTYAQHVRKLTTPFSWGRSCPEQRAHEVPTTPYLVPYTYGVYREG